FLTQKTAYEIEPWLEFRRVLFRSLVIAHAVGYSLTRRTLPLAGAGVVELLLPLTLVAGGSPLAGAVLGVFVYRICNLWLPLVPRSEERRVGKECWTWRAPHPLVTV